MTSLASANLVSPSAVVEQGQDNLELAAQAVDQALSKDRSFLDLAELLQVPNHSQASVSGWHDADYPSFSDPKMHLATRGQIGQLHRAPLPSELLEQFAHMQCNCMMGIFRDIGRAWLTVDSDIFVWNYQDGSDLAYFDGLSETIFSVGLVRPKPGVFQSHIEWLLCLTTPVDIVLLGVSFSSQGPGSKRDMHLLPDPLFCLPTDGVQMLQIMGTLNGRIFLAGRDGCLYEVVYQAADGWFSRKCRKINHTTSRLAFIVPSFLNAAFTEDDAIVQIVSDQSRNMLYTRSEQGTIQAYHMGADGKSLRRIAAMSNHTITQAATAIAKTIDKCNFNSVITIAPVTLSESEYVHLVAITTTGMRLYFSTSRFDSASGYGARGQPHVLVMVHVRLPPGFSMSSSQQRPHNIHAACYSDGTLVMAGKEGADKDMLWVVSADAFPFHKQLRETADVIPIEGRVWAMAEAVQSDNFAASVPNGLEPPAVVVQHQVYDRKFVLVNSLGTCIVSKNLPVGQLRYLLECDGPDSPQIGAFFEVSGEQACASSVQLACSQRTVDTKVAEMAAVAFFKHGGSADVNFNLTTPVANVGPGQFYYGASSPQSPQASFRPGQVSTPLPNNVTQQLNFTAMDHSMLGGQGHLLGIPGSVVLSCSPRHNGLCLYLGRLVRSLWDARLASEYAQPRKLLYSTVSASDVTQVLEKLKELSAFMNKYSQFISPLLAESYSTASRMKGILHQTQDLAEEHLHKKRQAEADSQESASLRRIEELLIRCCECLGLWKILGDHQLHVIGQHLSQEQQSVLKMQTLRTLLTNGKDVCGQLISTLINLYIDDNAATDAISDRLREICPSLYSQEDAVCAKANEKLLTSHTLPNQREREKQLAEALSLYKQISLRLNLSLVTGDFKNAHYFSGIVDLALTAALKRDPQGLGLHYYRNGESPDDVQGLAIFSSRMECYQCILESFEHLLDVSQAHPQAPSIPATPGPPPTQDPNRLSNLEAEKFAEDMFSLALKSEDELFHVALYDWLVSKNMSEKLLEIQSPFLEVYLKRRAANQPDQLPVIDLLWKFYEKNNNFSAASRILAKLADQSLIQLDLTTRMEYLSRAIICAKSSTTAGPGGSDGEFLHQLEEKMDVARLQVQILDTLSSDVTIPGADRQEARQRLNLQLLDITTLYSQFADAYGLAECSLAVLHCAGHNDPTLVQTLWQDIITKELRSSRAEGRNIMMNCLFHKLVSLGKQYSNSERYFPLAFLIKYLEMKSCELQFFDHNPSFVVNILLEVGVTLPRLFEYYDRLLKSKDPCWAAMHQPLHLLKVIYRLLVSYCETPNLVASYERRRFTLMTQDLVSGYLVELASLLGSGTTDEARILVNDYKSLQAKLERICD